MKIVINILGILVVMAIMYLLSASKKDVPLKTVLKALGIQFIIAFILVKFPLGRLAIEKVSDVVTQVLTYGMDGISSYLEVLQTHQRLPDLYSEYKH